VQGVAVEREAVRGVHEALARDDGRYARLLKSLARVELLILDVWGLAPLTSQQGRDLLEIVDHRYGRGSTILTSQLPVDHWHEAIVDPTIAVAILDRKGIEQAWHPIVEHRSIVAACLVSERAGESTFAGAGFAGDQEVLAPVEPTVSH
jgi:hypothetical protein